MSKPWIKRVFPGGNTPLGFYSFYDFVLPREKGKKLILLKGGPGTGKSSFMKTIGQKFLDLQYNIEFHHCSSDPASVDAMVVPELKVGIIDGTAPHIVDPIYPGAVDEILYLGNHWDGKKLQQQKEKIISLKKQTNLCFQKAYGYLRAAGMIYDNWIMNQKQYMDKGKYNEKVQSLLETLLGNLPISPTLGEERHLFGSAITPEGFTNFLPSIIGHYSRVYEIKDEPGASAEELLNTLYQQAIRRGLDVECYHSPIQVGKIEDLLIPSLDIAITVSNVYHHTSVAPTQTIDLTSCIAQSKQQSIILELEQDQKTFENLVEKAVEYLKKAKASHHELESYYIESMNFESMDDLMESTFQRLLQLA